MGCANGCCETAWDDTDGVRVRKFKERVEGCAEVGENPEEGEPAARSIVLATVDTFDLILSEGELVISRSSPPGKGRGEDVTDAVRALE